MKLDWLPKWRNESEYPNPDKTSNRQWAWEFLRRNSEYQKDYERFEVYLQNYPDLVDDDPFQDDDSSVPLNDYAICEPPALENETSRKYYWRMAKANQECCIKPLYVALAEKHGLALPGLRDPRKDDPGMLCFSALSGPSVSDLLDEKYLKFKSGMKPERVSEVVMKFKLENPIDTQIAKAKFILEMKQRSLTRKGLLRTKMTRNHSRNFVGYLRLLDAEVDGAEVREMAEVIFPDKENSYPDFLGDQAVRNQIKAARKLRDSRYCYLTLNDSLRFLRKKPSNK